ncbi:MAG: septation protein IspZ [Methylocystis sp.]|nr:septation protein IspZ [Methylocystis sp.]
MSEEIAEKKVAEATGASGKRRMRPGLKFALEMGPLILFFSVNHKFGIFPATGALMVGVLTTLAVSYAVVRHVPTMPLVTAAFVLVFGSLTFFLQDETFIKLKVTILYSLFGASLLGALWFGKLLLPAVFDMAFHLDEEGWRKLTWRWAQPADEREQGRLAGPRRPAHDDEFAGHHFERVVEQHLRAPTDTNFLLLILSELLPSKISIFRIDNHGE